MIALVVVVAIVVVGFPAGCVLFLIGARVAGWIESWFDRVWPLD